MSWGTVILEEDQIYRTVIFIIYASFTGYKLNNRALRTGFGQRLMPESDKSDKSNLKKVIEKISQ